MPHATIRILGGILRISTKYAVPHLRRRTLSVLQTRIPPASDGLCGSRLAIGDLFFLANVAREVNASALLIVILYWCANVPFDSIYDGSPWGGDPIMDRSSLSPENLRSVLRSIPMLSYLARAVTYPPLFTAIGCGQHSCALDLRRVADKVLKGRVSDGFVRPIIAAHRRPYLPGKNSPSLCAHCCDTINPLLEAGSQAAWNELPKIYGFDSWQVLLSAEENQVS